MFAEVRVKVCIEVEVEVCIKVCETTHWPHYHLQCKFYTFLLDFQHSLMTTIDGSLNHLKL